MQSKKKFEPLMNQDYRKIASYNDQVLINRHFLQSCHFYELQISTLCYKK